MAFGTDVTQLRSKDDSVRDAQLFSIAARLQVDALDAAFVPPPRLRPRSPLPLLRMWGLLPPPLPPSHPSRLLPPRPAQAGSRTI
jgi:hypothetical protein